MSMRYYIKLSFFLVSFGSVSAAELEKLPQSNESAGVNFQIPEQKEGWLAWSKRIISKPIISSKSIIDTTFHNISQSVSNPFETDPVEQHHVSVPIKSIFVPVEFEQKVEKKDSQGWLDYFLNPLVPDMRIDTQGISVDLIDRSLQLADEFKIQGVTSESIASLQGADTNLADSVLLTEESLSKIKVIDSWLKSWTLAPFRKTLKYVYPIEEFSQLISELATGKEIPRDIADRIKVIVDKIPFMPKIVKVTMTGIGIKMAESNQKAFEFIQEAVPDLSLLAKGMQGYEQVQKIVQQHSGDHLEALRVIANSEIEILKNVPLRELIKTVDNIQESKTQTIQTTKNVNKIVTQVSIILFALAMTSIVLSIIQASTQNPIIAKAVEILMILDLIGIAGGLGYGSVSVSKLLNRSSVKGATQDVAAKVETVQFS